MANNLNGLFTAVLTSANTNLQLMPEFANNFLATAYTGYSGETAVAGVGQTITINMPVVDEANVVDIGNGPVVLKDTNQVPVSIPADKKFSTTRIIKNFDQARTPINMQTQYLRPMVEEVMRAANRYTAGIAYAAATVNAKITGPASAFPAFSRQNLANAWQNLINQGCPGSSLACLIAVTPYSNMVGDDSNKFISQFIVGTEAAVSAQQSARLMPTFGATLDWDQHCTTLGANGTYGGLFLHKMALAIAPFTEKGLEGSQVKRTIIFPTKDGKIPFQVQMWESGEGQGVVIHVSLCMGAKAIKPEWIQYLETAPIPAQGS